MAFYDYIAFKKETSSSYPYSSLEHLSMYVFYTRKIVVRIKLSTKNAKKYIKNLTACDFWSPCNMYIMISGTPWSNYPAYHYRRTSEDDGTQGSNSPHTSSSLTASEPEGITLYKTLMSLLLFRISVFIVLVYLVKKESKHILNVIHTNTHPPVTQYASCLIYEGNHAFINYEGMHEYTLW